jgi:ABC-2 type transport system permease protein
MRPIILREVYERRKSIVWWIVGIAVYVELNLLIYPTISQEADQLNQVLNNMPETVKNLVAGSSDFLSPVGYLNAKLYYLFLPLLLGMLVIGLGTSLLARDEQDHTLELTLARPISRFKVLAAKAIAGVLILSIVGAGTLVATLLGAAAGGFELPLAYVASATLLNISLVLIFGAVAFAITAAKTMSRSLALGMAILVGLGGYITSSLAKDVTWLENISRLLPFHYYHPDAALRGDFPLASFLCYIGISVLLFVIGAVLFQRRDIS